MVLPKILEVSYNNIIYELPIVCDGDLLGYKTVTTTVTRNNISGSYITYTDDIDIPEKNSVIWVCERIEHENRYYELYTLYITDSHELYLPLLNLKRHNELENFINETGI